MGVTHNNTTVFLIGMPGVGKSYWGQQLAEAYGLSFADLDAVIVAREGMPIAQIFDAYGEAGFRERERKYLIQTIGTAGKGSVIACGGGTPCFYDNMEVMKKAGVVIYLNASPGYLYENLLKSVDERPLITMSQPVMATITELLAQRLRFYEQAHHILQAEDISLATFAKILGYV